MNTGKAKITMVRAQHATMVDRKGNPIVKAFTPVAWASLHDENWTVIDGDVPAQVKTKTKAQAPAKLKKSATTPKKAVLKKSPAKSKTKKLK
jgi:hypothetical protein